VLEQAKKDPAMTLSSSNLYVNFALGFLIGGLAVALANPELNATLTSVLA
jgi:hypothetical protein